MAFPYSQETPQVVYAQHDADPYVSLICGSIFVNTLTNKFWISTNTLGYGPGSWTPLIVNPSAVAWSGSYNDLLNKPSFASVATSGNYNDLSNLPTIPATQVNSDWNATSGLAQILNKPTIGKAIIGTDVKTGTFKTYKNATVSAGVATFYLTDDATATGNALYNEIFTDSVNLFVNDSTSSYQLSYIFSNNNKTLTVTVNKISGVNLVSGLLNQIAANGISIKLTVEGS